MTRTWSGHCCRNLEAAERRFSIQSSASKRPMNKLWFSLTEWIIMTFRTHTSDLFPFFYVERQVSVNHLLRWLRIVHQTHWNITESITRNDAGFSTSSNDWLCSRGSHYNYGCRSQQAPTSSDAVRTFRWVELRFQTVWVVRWSEVHGPFCSLSRDDVLHLLLHSLLWKVSVEKNTVISSRRGFGLVWIWFDLLLFYFDNLHKVEEGALSALIYLPSF